MSKTALLEIEDLCARVADKEIVKEGTTGEVFNSDEFKEKFGEI